MKIKKQTAVEWLEQSLKLSDNVSEFDKWAFDKAKEMEKEQKAKEYMKGYNDAKNFNTLITKTFKSE